MKSIYLISRYRAQTRRELELNIAIAAYYARAIVRDGNKPVVPHLYYTNFLDDNDPKERQDGLMFGLMDMNRSDEFLMVVVDGVISEGMQGELKNAERIGMVGRVICLTGQEAMEIAGKG